MTPDVNVLVAAVRKDHLHHTAAHAWLSSARIQANERGSGLSLLPMVIADVVRVATSVRIFPVPTPNAVVLQFVDQLLATRGVTMVTVGDEWSTFTELVIAHSIVGASVCDAWIAAAVIEQHEHLVTFDTGFKRYLKPRQLTVLAS